jgi:hypothetical protein
MAEGGHVSHQGTGCLPFLFNQSGKFIGCGGWRFAHAVSLHRAKGSQDVRCRQVDDSEKLLISGD